MVTAEERLNAARHWITRGGKPPCPPPELAADCDLLIRNELSASVRRALKLSETFTKRAQASADPTLRLSALRALARCQHMGGRHREALKHYRSARLEAHRLKDRMGAARIERALTDVLMYLNRYADAERVCRSALRTFRSLGADADAVQCEVNLANLYHRQDRHEDAARIYARAEAFFAESQNELARARVAYNLANTQVQLFAWEQAVAGYLRAEEIYLRHEFTLDANDARYGLAYIDLLSDRFAEALTRLEQCERIYREQGDPRGAALCMLDLAEAYLGLNLFEEALTSGRRAALEFTRLKLRYERAKTRLYMAYASAGLGRRSDARRFARSAQTAFARERNLGMQASTQLLLAQLVESRKGRRQRLLEVRRLFDRAQLPIWSLLCDLHLFADPAAPRSVGQRLMRQKGLQRVPHWSALHDGLRGDRARAAGRRAEARRCWQRAADTLEQARAAMPPLELRAAYLRGRTDPYHRLIELQADEDALAAAEWAERLKTSGIWSPVHREQTGDPEAKRLRIEWQRLQSRLSALARHIRPGTDTQATRTARRAERNMRNLERQSRHLLMQLEARELRRADSATSIRQSLTTVSKQMPIVVWHTGARDLYAFVIRDGDATAHVWPDGTTRVRSDLRRWRFFIERHMLAASGSTVADPAEERFWSEFGTWLWEPLELEGSGGGHVLIIPEGELFALPFTALRCGGSWLGDRCRPVVAPSLRHYLAARESEVKARHAVVHDAGAPDLGAVPAEVDMIRSLWGGPDFEVRRPAQRSDVLGLTPARFWHFAGHARFRADNPFYSALQLADGPVFATDLRTRRVPVDVATLSACHSGGGEGAPGEEFAGLVRSVLEMGARTVVAGLWPVADESTAHWMQAFYRSFKGGNSRTAAVQKAEQATRRRWPSPYHWSAFALFGSEA